MKSHSEPNGLDALEEAVKHPTLDVYLDRHPKLLSVEDKLNLIKMLRAERAMFIGNDMNKKRKAKK